MRPIFIVLILNCFLNQVSAQKQDLDENINLYHKDSLGTLIRLPDLQRAELYYYHELYPGAIAIRDSAQYHTLFKKYKSELPLIDFQRYYLQPRRFCVHCMTVCFEIGRILEPCHRQACGYILRWWLVEKMITKNTN